MRKMVALIGLAAALALAPAAAFAEQGTSSSYGSVGLGPHYPNPVADALRSCVESRQSKQRPSESRGGMASRTRESAAFCPDS